MKIEISYSNNLLSAVMWENDEVKNMSISIDTTDFAKLIDVIQISLVTLYDQFHGIHPPLQTISDTIELTEANKKSAIDTFKKLLDGIPKHDQN